ncbi:hypothetical protein Fbal_1285 [Ferrimonas balearica DSM 9799]|uniref:Uncharacterized protein n=1 Tax=Ferrimonas balearica (strain DSM 9799 / CCM 4581 / KCTC 23876 / PAT) TaxID=550540 RepID=E1SLV9_FERBD|nr:DUF2796 domain-containing protein [Ferrimonas balearica]ADN75491.1 hypothetical protein Fbal_1285 [Ferrimonas balearica DSM 9799]
MKTLTLTAVAITATLSLSACHPHDDHDHGHDHAATDQSAVDSHAHDSHLKGAMDHDHDHDHDHQHHGAGHGAHVHGEGELTLIQEGNEVMVELSLPTDSLWGFERAPQNDDERALVQQVLGQLTAGHRFFVLSSGADCEPSRVEITPPAGLDNPDASGHMELEAQWFWTCQGPIKALEVPLFKHYPDIHRLTLQRLTEQGSGGAELTPNSPSVQW